MPTPHQSSQFLDSDKYSSIILRTPPMRDHAGVPFLTPPSLPHPVEDMISCAHRNVRHAGSSLQIEIRITCFLPRRLGM